MLVLFVSVLQFVCCYQVLIFYDFVYVVIGSVVSDVLLSFFFQFDVKVWGVEIYIFFKIFNMVGWCFGFVVGNVLIIWVFKKLYIYSYSMVFGVIQDVVIVVFNLLVEWIMQLMVVYY